MFRSSNRETRRGGFSLVELLIAVAITVTLLTAIFTVFLSVMQAVARGHNTQKGYELARGTLHVIKQDVTASFTARDKGIDEQLFGTPIGMMLIGHAGGSGTSNTLSRITYVVYLPSAQQVPFEQIATINGKKQGTGQYVNRTTYSLLRYVEPGVNDLDSYPIDWVRRIQLAESPGWAQVNTELTAAMAPCPLPGDFQSVYSYLRTNPNAASPLPKDVQIRVAAKKRELWIRMLAGEKDLPNAWEILDKIEKQKLVNQQIPFDPNVPLVDWHDYVVAENLAYMPPQGAEGTPKIDPTNPGATSPAFFTYGTILAMVNQANPLGSRTPVYVPMTYWNSVYNIDPAYELDFMNVDFLRQQGLSDPTIEQLAENSQIGSPLLPRLPELIGIRVGYQLESPFVGVPEFDKVFGQVIDVPTGYTRKSMTAATS